MSSHVNNHVLRWQVGAESGLSAPRLISKHILLDVVQTQSIPSKPNHPSTFLQFLSIERRSRAATVLISKQVTRQLSPHMYMSNLLKMIYDCSDLSNAPLQPEEKLASDSRRYLLAALLARCTALIDKVQVTVPYCTQLQGNTSVTRIHQRARPMICDKQQRNA